MRFAALRHASTAWPPSAVRLVLEIDIRERAATIPNDEIGILLLDRPGRRPGRQAYADGVGRVGRV